MRRKRSSRPCWFPIGKANAIKRDEPITVVIGNPPYKVDAAGQGGWVEKGSPGRPSPMDLWAPPPEWGLGAHAKHLKTSMCLLAVGCMEGFRLGPRRGDGRA